MFSEIELVINNHRLHKYVHNELKEPQALAPAHFLFPGQENICYPVHVADHLSSKPSNEETFVADYPLETNLEKVEGVLPPRIAVCARFSASISSKES